MSRGPPIDYDFPFGNPKLLRSTSPYVKGPSLREQVTPIRPSKPLTPIPALFRPQTKQVYRKDFDELPDKKSFTSSPGHDIARNQADYSTLSADLRQQTVGSTPETQTDAFHISSKLEFGDELASASTPELHSLRNNNVAMTSQEFSDKLAPEPTTNVQPLVQDMSSVATWEQQHEDMEDFSKDQIYVLGTDIRGSFITHCLSGWRAIPPVRMLLHRNSHMNAWDHEGGAISVVREGVPFTRHRAQAQMISRPDTMASLQEPPIDHIIITVPCSTTVRAVEPIKHRIDHQTVVCLVQDGLGVMEALNEAYFPDPLDRPRYIMGHFTHQLTPNHRRFSLVETARGKLCVAAYDHDPDRHPLLSYYPPKERQEYESRFLRLLVTAPDLGAGGYSWPIVLQMKLMDMALKSAMDSVAAVLDVPIFQLGASPYARNLLFRILGEIAEVMLALPEMQELPDVLDLIRLGELTRLCRNKLWSRSKQTDNKMRQDIALGKDTEVDFLNGYFVRRGKEVGVACPSNQLLIDMIHAKVKTSKRTIEEWIPLDPRRTRYG